MNEYRRVSTTIYDEVKENIEYITEVEGIEIPQVWQDKILQPLDFAIAQNNLTK